MTFEEFVRMFITVISRYAEMLRKVVNSQCRTMEPWQIIAYTLFLVFVLLWSKHSLSEYFGEGVYQQIVRRVRKLPIMSVYVDKKMDGLRRKVEKQLNKGLENKVFLKALPKTGWSQDKVLSELDSYLSYGTYAWDKGRVSGAVYHGNDAALKDLVTSVYGKTAYHNPLHPDVFPGIRLMEAEIIRIVCTLFGGDEDTCGTVTTGGTESILLACKAYRDYAKSYLGIKEPNMVVPINAHAAFDKAAQLLRIEIKHVSVDSDNMSVNIKAMERSIDKNTCMLVGSAPAFPHGNIDPIEDISKLGEKYNIPVHVDSCLGGFLVPFMKKAGFEFPPFDFTLPGVTSISADTHKYAYAPKGTSVIMYRNSTYLHCQYSTQPNWPGGIYGTPTLAGSRSGGLIATCWATLTYLGEDFYVDATKKIITTAKYIEKGVKRMPELYIYGQPEVSVIAIGSGAFDVFSLSAAMSDLGWSLNTLQFPPGFHFCVTLQHTHPGVADKFLSDLRECTKVLALAPDTEPQGTAAVYGMSQKIPDRSLVCEMVWAFLDSCTSTRQLQEKENT